MFKDESVLIIMKHQRYVKKRIIQVFTAMRGLNKEVTARFADKPRASW